MSNGRPQNIPTCEHGKRAGQYCADCSVRDVKIKEAVQPLAKEFWIQLPKRNANLEQALYQAYRMGMRHDNA